MKVHAIKIICFIVAIIGLLLTTSTLFGQQNNSLYYMHGIPQSNQLNPAIQSRFGVYVGIPGFSSLEINAGNSAVGFSDIFISNIVKDSLVYPLHNQATKDKFLSKFSKVNSLYSELRLDWFSFGFRINDSYISFSAADRVENYFNIPYDLIDLGVNQNLAPNPSTPTIAKTFDFSGFGVNSTWYREYALGYSQQVNDNITFGVRGKLLFGKANLTSKNAKIYQNMGIDSWKSQANIEINSSIPDAQVYYNKDNNIDSVVFDKKHNISKVLLNSSNPGFAVDLGFIYKFSEMFNVSASILDLGFIQWKNNINSLSQHGSYSFNGIPIRTDSVKIGDAFVDTLKKAFTYSHNQDPYLTTLSGKIYLGAYFQPVKWIGLGALSRFQRLNSEIQQQYTFSLNIYPASYFNLTVSYTIADKMYDNLGAGLCFKTGPLQWYFMSERIPLHWTKISNGGYLNGKGYIPYDARNINYRMGVNLVFGSERHKKLKKDKPLVEI